MDCEEPFFILDSNVDEKNIIEFNNHLSLGQYELARTFYNQIKKSQPSYFETFFKVIFTRGIPIKWILTDQIRSSAHYICLIFQDYLRYFDKQAKSVFLVKSSQFDTLLLSAFYSSYEQKEKNISLHLDLLKILRKIYNKNLALSSKTAFFLPALRFLNPSEQEDDLFLLINEAYYSDGESESVAFDEPFVKQQIELLLLSSLETGTRIFKELFFCLEIKEEKEFFQNTITKNFIDLILLFIENQDYTNIFHYVKHFLYFSSNKTCCSLVKLLFLVLAFIANRTSFKAKSIENFLKAVINTSNSAELSYFLENTFFSKFAAFKLNSAYKSEMKDRILFKFYLYEAVLSNENSKLLAALHEAEDLLVAFDKKEYAIPAFFQEYSSSVTSDYYSFVKIVQLCNKAAYSKGELVNISRNARFWQNYLHFLRVTNSHCLSYPIMQAVKHVRLEEFKSAAIFLEPFLNLRPLLVLAVWEDFIGQTLLRKDLLNTFWEPYLDNRDTSEDFIYMRKIENICDSLSYKVDLSLSVHSLGTKTKRKDANIIYQELLGCSLPKVLESSLNNIEVSEFLEVASRVVPKISIDLKKRHFNSVMLILSFYVYQSLLNLINDYILENRTENLLKEDSTKQILTLLDKIPLIPYRLNLIRDVFDFIFLRYIEKKEKIAKGEAGSKYLFSKQTLDELLDLINRMTKPFETFDFDDIESMFRKPFLSEDSISLANCIENKQNLIEHLEKVDSSHREGTSYIAFSQRKLSKLLADIKDLEFRYAIVDNLWVSMIFDSNNTFLELLLQKDKFYLDVCLKLHKWEETDKVKEEFSVEKDTKIDFEKFREFIKIKENLTKIKDLEEIEKSTNNLVEDCLEGVEGKIEVLSTLFNLIFVEKMELEVWMKLVNRVDTLITELKDSVESEKICFMEETLKTLKLVKNFAQKDAKLRSGPENIVWFHQIKPIKKHEAGEKWETSVFDNLEMKESVSNLEKLIKDKQIEGEIKINEGFQAALSALKESKHLEENKLRDSNTFYLTNFLQYLVDLGEIYAKVKAESSKSASTNYLELLRKEPETIIARILLKYKAEGAALEVSKMTKKELITVVRGYTAMSSRPFIDFGEFNSFIRTGQTEQPIYYFPVQETFQTKKYPIGKQTLEYLYDLYSTRFSGLVPLFISFYRINTNKLSSEDIFFYWEALLQRYSKHSIFGRLVIDFFSKFRLNYKLASTDKKYDKLFSKYVEQPQKEEEINVKLPEIRSFMPIDRERVLQIFKKKTENTLEFPQKAASVPVDNQSDTNSSSRVRFFISVATRLFQAKDYQGAYKICKSKIRDTSVPIYQSVVAKMVETTSDEEVLSKLLLVMSDIERVFTIIKENCLKWQAKNTINLLEHARVHTRPSECAELIRKIKLYSKILEVDSFSEMNFEQIEAKKQLVIKKLLVEGEHELCFAFIDFHDLREEREEALFSELTMLLNSSRVVDKIKAMEKISNMKEVPEIAVKLIDKVKNRTNKLVLIHYVLDNCTISGEIKQELEQKKVFLDIFFQMDAVEQGKMESLTERIDIKVETLLINMRFDTLKKVKKTNPAVLSDSTLCFYAKRAICFEKSTIVIKHDHFYTFTPEEFESKKGNFSFESSPSFQNFCSFMNLCSNSAQVASECFQVCLDISKYLNSQTERENKLIYLFYIDNVLDYLEKRANKNLVQRVLKFKRLSEFARRMVLLRLTEIPLNFASLEEDSKLLEARDKLISLDLVQFLIK